MPDEIIKQINVLYELSDIDEQEFLEWKQHYLSTGKSILLCKQLASRSIIPRIRNTQRPPGEIYAPVLYNKDYIIKLVSKPKWGGYILALTVWDLVIIDIDSDAGDDEDPLIYIRKNIEKFYPDELFYINRTNRGYHVYLVSKTLKYSSRAAIYMRIRLNGDPAHGANSLYNGHSVRLSRKSTDKTEIPSQFCESCGKGSLDPQAYRLYNEIQGYISKFGCHEPDIVSNKSLMHELYEMWCNTMQYNNDFGLVHIKSVSPMFLVKTTNGIETETAQVFNIYNTQLGTIIKKIWDKFLKHRVIKDNTLVALQLCSQHNVCLSNLYRILEASDDYAIGVHIQDSCHFIAYKDLLLVDYDHKNRLKILKTYVRFHPEATFRVVSTTKGHHAFLTSYPVHYSRGTQLLRRLCSDPCHLLGAFHRGYSVRINRKHQSETPYKEVCKIGIAQEDPRLLMLYLKHLDLYRLNDKTETYMCQRITARNIVKYDGYM
jgi:hypothetical protein